MIIQYNPKKRIQPFFINTKSKKKMVHISFRIRDYYPNKDRVDSLCQSFNIVEYEGTIDYSGLKFYNELPKGYKFCQTCLSRAYASDLIKVDFLPKKELTMADYLDYLEVK